MKSRKRIAALATGLLLSGCCPIGHGTDSFCALARPIYVSRADVLSDGTARQIYDGNMVGKELCGWGKGEFVR